MVTIMYMLHVHFFQTPLAFSITNKTLAGCTIREKFIYPLDAKAVPNVQRR